MITKTHCFFEQSGTFKKEFIKLGIPAEDYDIQDSFGETDHIVDLFAEIDQAYVGVPSIFDNIGEDDLILAFFPCIYFCAMSQCAFSLGYKNYQKKSNRERIFEILKREESRHVFYRTLIKFCAVCIDRKIKMILENPWNEQTFLKANFLKAPDFVDWDRTRRGDDFQKPTAFWFWNCEPRTNISTLQKNTKTKAIMNSKKAAAAGLCSEERSMISPDYARNFICDVILGIPQDGVAQQPELI